MTSVLKLQRELEQAGVLLSLTDGRLRYSLRGPLPERLKSELGRRKAVLVELLRDPCARLRSFATTPPQRQLWALANLHADGRGYLAYVESVLYVVEGRLDFDCLERATARLVRRHAALRTEFEAEGTRQTVVPGGDVSLVSLGEGSKSELLERLRAVLSTPHPLDTAPSPCVVAGVSGDETLVGLVIHHVKCDGVGLCRLLDELGQLYAEDAGAARANLVEAPGFEDYVLARAELRASEQCERSREHFRNVLRDAESAPPPGDARTRRYDAGRRTTVVAERWTRFARVAKLLRVTPFALALAAFARAVSEIGALESVTGLVSLDARDLTGCSDVIGYCSEVYPVVLRPRLPVAELAEATCRSLFGVMAHHACSLADLAAEREGLALVPHFTATFLDLEAFTSFGGRNARVFLPEVAFRDAPLTLNLHKLPGDRMHVCCDWCVDWVDAKYAEEVLARAERALIDFSARG